MAIVINDGFSVTVAKAIDERTNVNTVTDRNNIPLGVRYLGMRTYVRTTNQEFQLVGGTANANWQSTSGVAGAGFSWQALAITVDYSFGSTYDKNAFVIDATAGDIDILLPSTFDRPLYFKRIDNTANVVSFLVTGGLPIDDELVVELKKQYDTLTLAYNPAYTCYYILNAGGGGGLDTSNFINYLYGDELTDGSIRINTTDGTFTTEKRVSGTWTFMGSFGV